MNEKYLDKAAKEISNLLMAGYDELLMSSTDLAKAVRLAMSYLDTDLEAYRVLSTALRAWEGQEEKDVASDC